LASALAMDKLRSRQVGMSNGLPFSKFVVVDGGAWPGNRGEVAAQVASELGYPCVVKPNAQGSSIGVSIVQTAEGLVPAVDRALGCEGMSRTDMFLRGDALVLLEVNTIPGLTSGSLLPRAAAAAGIEFSELVNRIIGSALRRERGRRNRKRGG